MLNAQDIAQMRATQEAALPERVTIERTVRIADGLGGMKTSGATTVATNVPARITEAQTQAFPGQAARKLAVEIWTVSVPIGTDLIDEDYIVWGDWRLQVTNVKARSWDTVLRGQAERIK